MPTARAKENRDVSLPQEAWDALNLRAGDELDAEIVEGGVLLRKATTDRQKAWDRLMEIVNRPKFAGPGPEPTDDEILEQAVEDVHWAREQHEGRRR